ncbi:MAG: type I-B CRISPR-associated endonuclease Cas1b [Bacteroidetes bacterium]|nr:type I-B CRISPR-associated endonuclease Cas1b [Bacteroidota bacterium]MBU1678848.1 type I-B CRISPR-associated endonuclease Cas1b [Bacteroidota bacterium]
MKQNLYIFSDTIIKRSNNTILCEKVIKDPIDEEEIEEKDFHQSEFLLDEECIIPSGDKKYIPVESIDSIFTFGSIRFNSRFLYFLSQNKIPLHSFTYNGAFAGSFLPADRNISGSILTLQVSNYLNHKRRLHIAKELSFASAKNCLSNLKYHRSRGASVIDVISILEDFIEYIFTAVDVQELLGIEGNIKKHYYTAWRKIFHYPVDFTHRIKNPPNNLINSLISYGNMIVYSLCLNQIYQTRLYPEVGFIHEVGEGKLPLCYDLADVFKPLFTDRTIFKVINKNMISEKDCFRKNNRCFLKQNAKKIFVTELENKFSSIVTLENNRSMSYKRIVKEDCYKLIKHLNGEHEYKGFISKW